MAGIPYVNEKTLGLTVQKYPVLYDRSTRGFYNKETRQLAWKDVAKAVDLETGELWRYI